MHRAPFFREPERDSENVRKLGNITPKTTKKCTHGGFIRLGAHDQTVIKSRIVRKSQVTEHCTLLQREQTKCMNVLAALQMRIRKRTRMRAKRIWDCVKSFRGFCCNPWTVSTTDPIKLLLLAFRAALLIFVAAMIRNSELAPSFHCVLVLCFLIDEHITRLFGHQLRFFVCTSVMFAVFLLKSFSVFSCLPDGNTSSQRRDSRAPYCFVCRQAPIVSQPAIISHLALSYSGACACAS